MKIQSSNKQAYYTVTLDSCNCLDFVKRNKSQNRLSCKCEYTFQCSKCSCRHQRDNLADIMNEEIKQ